MRVKEFLYVGHYIDVDGNYILKVGTTNNLDRRKREHSRTYKKAVKNPIAPGENFEYDWTLKLSPQNTLRYEAKTKESWKQEDDFQYLPNDRFVCKKKLQKVRVTIRKTYEIEL